MKLIDCLVAGVVLGAACARPLVNKRALVTEVVYVTEVADTVVVYVDENGEPYMTTTEADDKATSTPSVVIWTTSVAAQTTLASSKVPQASSSAAPAPPAAPSSLGLPGFNFSFVTKEAAPPSSAAPYVAPSSTPQAAATSTPPPAPVPTPDKPSPAAAPAPAASDVPAHKDADSAVLGIGITYDPFAGASTSTSCKSDDQFAADFAKLKDYKVIRLYGMGCNQIPNAVKAAVKQNQKLMAGTYLSNGGDGEDLTASIQAWTNAIKTYASGNWNIVSLFSIENERVNEHDLTASAVIDAIQRGRKQLRAAGYNGPVGAVETVPAMVDNPAICDASDVVMVNCHAFFDSNTSADGAGKFVRSEVNRVGQACKNKRVVVTESGWPHQGDPNGKAIASPDNQRIALQSIRAEFSGDMFLHNAFDSTWKSDTSATFNAERYWGVTQ